MSMGRESLPITVVVDTLLSRHNTPEDEADNAAHERLRTEVQAAVDAVVRRDPDFRRIVQGEIQPIAQVGSAAALCVCGHAKHRHSPQREDDFECQVRPCSCIGWRDRDGERARRAAQVDVGVALSHVRHPVSPEAMEAMDAEARAPGLWVLMTHPPGPYDGFVELEDEQGRGQGPTMSGVNWRLEGDLWALGPFGRAGASFTPAQVEKIVRHVWEVGKRCGMQFVREKHMRGYDVDRLVEAMLGRDGE